MTRVFDAPREIVWRAWTEPERVARWWGPRGFTSRVTALEVRPGGSIRIDMGSPDGSTHPMSGTFREVVPPERLVFASAAVDGAGQVLFETLTSITLAERGAARTVLTVEMRVLRASAEAAPHLSGAEAGWTQQLERLASYVGSAEGTASAGQATDAAAAAGPAVAGEAGARSAAMFTIASENEIVARRTFDAPRWLVFLALSRAEHFARWWGPRGFVNTIHEMDVRPGGVWRITQRAPDGGEHHFEGVYREVIAPERIVHTQRYGTGSRTEGDAVVTMRLDERDGTTTLTTTIRLASAAERDGLLQSGLEWGARQSWERLAEHLAGTAVGPETPWTGDIVASRVFAAPRDLVWRLWTDPRHVARWWGPRGFRTTVREMDVRPGGTWRFVMHAPDGTDYDNEMVYAEVRAPERLVYSHTVPPRFRQEVTFADLGGGVTRVAVRSAFERADDVQPYAVEGMAQTLERLEAALAAAPAG